MRRESRTIVEAPALASRALTAVSARTSATAPGGWVVPLGSCGPEATVVPAPRRGAAGGIAPLELSPWRA